MKRTQQVGKSKSKSKTKMKTYNAREARKVALRNGWVFVRCKGSHHIYKHPESNKILTIAEDLNRMVWERVVNEYGLNLEA